MKIKEGADLRFLRPEMEQYLTRIERIFMWWAPDEFVCTVTSGSDGAHSRGSKHYKNLGVDFRVWYLDVSGRRVFLTDNVQQKIAFDIRALNPEDLDVLIEATHIHVEYDT